MVVGHRQQVRRPRLQPIARRHALALRAMPVAAGIIGDVLVAAGGAGRHMSAEGGGSAGLDRRHLLQLGEAGMTGPGNTLGGAPPCRAVVAEDVRDLQRWTGHRLPGVSRTLAPGAARRGRG